MDGVLLIDKPLGPTSHDVVARLRRATGERRIGHAGTLDPRASGLLVMVLGKATRLAALLTGSDKTYDATIQLGFATETDDAEGAAIDGPYVPVPGPSAVAAALDGFRGTFAQTPPQHSAKKVDGHRAYALARNKQPVTLAPVAVTVGELVCLEQAGNRILVRVTVSAGFYVRALARDLGAAIGCGGHLAALRRIRSGDFAVSDAMTPDEADRMGEELRHRLIPPVAALPRLRAIRLTEEGMRRAIHGNALGPASLEDPSSAVEGDGLAGPVRMLGADGRLVALATLRGGVLHPVIVLG